MEYPNWATLLTDLSLVQSSFPWIILFDVRRDIFHNTPWLMTHMIHESFSSHIERASFSAQQVGTVLWGWCHCTGKKSEKSQQCNRWLLVKRNIQFICSHQSPNDFRLPRHSKKILIAWVGLQVREWRLQDRNWITWWHCQAQTVHKTWLVGYIFSHELGWSKTLVFAVAYPARLSSEGLLRSLFVQSFQSHNHSRSQAKRFQLCIISVKP